METKKAQPRFTEEFKIEAVKQVTERGHPVAQVSVRLGVSTYSLYTWIKRYSVPAEQRAQHDSQADEIRCLKAGLRRVTEERDILKRDMTGMRGKTVHIAGNLLIYCKFL